MRERSRHTILMIGDDRDDRYITEQLFAELGYDIGLWFCHSGNDAMHLLEVCRETELPSLVILDRNLPGMDSLEVLRRIKESSRLSHIPVVVVCGTAFPAEVAACYRAGANSYIQKPESNKATTERIAAFLNYWFTTVDLPGRMARQQPLFDAIN